MVLHSYYWVPNTGWPQPWLSAGMEVFKDSEKRDNRQSNLNECSFQIIMYSNIAYIVPLHRAQARQTPFLEVQNCRLFAFQQEKYVKLLDTKKCVNYKKFALKAQQWLSALL